MKIIQHFIFLPMLTTLLKFWQIISPVSARSTSRSLCLRYRPMSGTFYKTMILMLPHPCGYQLFGSGLFGQRSLQELSPETFRRRLFSTVSMNLLLLLPYCSILLPRLPTIHQTGRLSNKFPSLKFTRQIQRMT